MSRPCAIGGGVVVILLLAWPGLAATSFPDPKPAFAPYVPDEEGGPGDEEDVDEEEDEETEDGAEPEPEPAKKKDVTGIEKFDIDYYISKAQENHPSIMAAKWELESYRKQLSEAHWAPYFNITFNTLFTPMSRLEGDALHSPQGEFDISTDMGIWIRMELRAGIPVYTFGKITSYWEMAEQGVKVGENKVEKEKQQIAFDVRRAFYSLQIAREILHVTEGGMDYLDKALEKVEEDLDNDEGNYTESDLKKLQTGKVRIEVEIVKARKIEKMALAALRFYTGEEDLDPPDVPIEPEQTEVGSLDQYLEAAHKNRPELKMLNSAIKVGKANVKLKKASMLPNFVLAGQYTYAYANKVEDQKTPFANDPFNSKGGGVALMLEWPLDIVPAAYRIGKAKADLFRLEAQQEEAMGGIGVEVELAFEDVREAADRMEVLGKGKKLGKGWIIVQSQNFDAGLSELKDFIDALTTYFEMYLLYYQAVYDFNVALANLRLVSGTDDIEALDVPEAELE